MTYEESLMVKVSWYYYFENMTQQAIADRLNISRMRVIKLLDSAQKMNIIQFHLRSDGIGMLEQSRSLMDRYQLKDVFIVPDVNDPSFLNEAIARAGAMYIADRLGSNACINVGYGDTLSKTLNHLATMVETPVTCISLTGGVSYYLPNGRSNIFNAKLCLIPAPLLVSSAEMAVAMMNESSVTDLLRMTELASFTLVGIGSMNEDATVIKSGVISRNDFMYLGMKNAVGDVLCHFFDKDGQLVQTPIEDRLIATSLEQLKAMPNVIGLAAGAKKVEAIRSALIGGYLDVLITDESTAAALLEA